MERVRFVEHKGQTILLLDCSSNSKDEAYEIFGVFDTVLRKQPPKSALVLCDFENAYHDTTIVGRWKKASSEHEKYARRVACIGVSGSFKIAMATYRFFARFAGVDVDNLMRFFGDENEAKDWLVQGDETDDLK